MAFRYQSGDRECVARDVDELERALRAGEIEKTTPVLDDSVGARLQAGALIAMLRRSAPAKSAATPIPKAAPPAAPSPKPAPAKTAKVAPPAGDSDTRRILLHKIAATVAAIIAVVVIAKIFDIPPYTVGQLTVTALIVLFVVVKLTGWILGKTSDRQKIRQAWIGSITWILFWVVMGVGIGAIREEGAAKDRAAGKALADAQRKHAATMEAVSKGDAPANTTPLPDTATAAPVPGKGRLLERIAPAIAATNAANLKALTDYKAFINSLHLDQVLSPPNLTSPQGRKAGGETTDKFVAGYEAFDKRLNEILDAHRQNLLDAVGQDPGREGFIVGMDRSLAAIKADYAEMLQIEQQLGKHMHAIIDFVASRSTPVTLEGGKMVFATDADVDRYNKLIEELDVISKKEDVVMARQLARLRGAADKIDAIVDGKK